MHLIAAPEFLDRFPSGESVIFVGNAPSLRGEKLGKWIDEHDVIVRFNESPIVGFQEDVGTRTDILVTNPYPENRQSILLSDRGIVLIISPQTRRLPSQQLESWTEGHPILFTYTPDIVQVGDIDHLAGLTTGVYGIHLLSRLLMPSKVAITGFTMFLSDTSYHYWRDVTPKGIQAHDMVVEASIFISICNAFRCSLEVTDDIAWVARRIGKELRPEVCTRSLVDMRWKS